MGEVKLQGSKLIGFLTLMLKTFGKNQTTLAEKEIKSQVKVLAEEKEKMIKDAEKQFRDEANKKKEAVIHLIDAIEEKAEAAIMRAKSVIEKDFAAAVEKVTDATIKNETVRREAVKIALAELLEEM